MKRLQSFPVYKEAEVQRHYIIAQVPTTQNTWCDGPEKRYLPQKTESCSFWKCTCYRPRGVKHRPHMVLWPPHRTPYPTERGLEPFFISLLVIQSDSFWSQLDCAHNTSNSCPAHFWLLAHLIILLVLASMTTAHQTKRQERLVLGNYRRYVWNESGKFDSRPGDTWGIQRAHAVGQVWRFVRRPVAP